MRTFILILALLALPACSGPTGIFVTGPMIVAERPSETFFFPPGHIEQSVHAPSGRTQPFSFAGKTCTGEVTGGDRSSRTARLYCDGQLVKVGRTGENYGMIVPWWNPADDLDDTFTKIGARHYRSCSTKKTPC